MPALAFDLAISAAPARTLGRSAAALLSQAGSTVIVWLMRARTRSDLARLDAVGHADIGLTAAEIRREVTKPFWRV